MSIQALSQTIVWGLGAAQVLTDPAALVKELVDNALDARATSIAIEIHSNTLNSIQVRDNGQGILPQDRHLAARRYCTSKLSHDDELKDIGGTSLGFRGEALASAAELSGSMTISTRVDGEPVGALLTIDQHGEVIGQDRTCMPVGTTVRITDFIKGNPVRRQVALKNVDACLKKIKRTLQSYAMARLHVRLSLRVVKSKNMKSDWLYAAKPGASNEDAVLKVVGPACMRECIWSVVEDRGFTFQACLPKPDAIAGDISNLGAFISVDHRPVASVRGTFKQVLKIFREALKRQSTDFDNVKDPFLYLDIECPARSYDVNIEPAKDDVLFEDATIVLDAVSTMFNAIYPRPGATVQDSEGNATQDKPKRNANEALNDQAAYTEDELTTSVELSVTSGHLPAIGENVAAASRSASVPRGAGRTLNQENSQKPQDATLRTTMYGCDEEDLDILDARSMSGRINDDVEDIREANRDVTAFNPWVLAKLNSTLHQTPKDTSGPESMQRRLAPDLNSSPAKRTRQLSPSAEIYLPTPRASSPLPYNHAFNPSDHVPNIRLTRDGRLFGSDDFQGPDNPSSLLASEARRNVVHNRLAAAPAMRTGRQQLTPDAQSGRSVADIPGSSKPRRSTRTQPRTAIVNKPFVQPPRKEPAREKVWFDHLEHLGRPKRSKQRLAPHDSPGLVLRGEPSDPLIDAHPLTPPRRNRDIRDFVRSTETGSNEGVVTMAESGGHGRDDQQPETFDENAPRRNERRDTEQVTALAGRGFVPASELQALQNFASSPEKEILYTPGRPRTSTRLPLWELSPNALPGADMLEQDQIQEQCSSRTISRRRSSHRLGRRTSSSLPLERTPAGQSVQNLVRLSSVTSHQLAVDASTLDALSLLGFNEPAFEVASAFKKADVHELTINLHSLLVKIGEDIDADPGSLFRELSTSLRQQGWRSESEDG